MTQEPTGLMSINEAIANGITRVRLDNWANSADHFEFAVFDGRPGPWVKLWSPANEVIGVPNPQKLIITMIGDLDEPCWRPYEPQQRGHGETSMHSEKR